MKNHFILSFTKIILFMLLAIGLNACQFITMKIIGIKQPELYANRQTSHQHLTKKIEKQTEGSFQILYRKNDFVEKTGLNEYYDLSLRMYNSAGQAADINKTAHVCEKTSFGYKCLRNGKITLDQLIWEEDVTAFGQLLLNLETIEGKDVDLKNLPAAKYYLVTDYSSFTVGPQRRKSRILRNALEDQQDSILTIYINADFIASDSLFLKQYHQDTLSD